MTNARRDGFTGMRARLPRSVESLRLAARSLGRARGFTVVTVLTLALAIGAATTVATVVDRALLRALPFRDAERLVTLLERDARGAQRLASYPEFRDIAAAQRAAFDGLSFVRGTSAVLRDASGAERLTIGYVSPGHFTVLGAAPLLGRVFTADEERTDAGSPLVISHDFWTRRFARDANVIGRTLSLDVGTVQIVGVMPPGTTFPAWADSWRPIAAIERTDPALSQRAVRSDSRIVARLRAGVDSAAAAAEIGRVLTTLAADHPQVSEGWTAADLTSLRDETIGPVRPMLFTLLGAVALGLLIACVNVAGLTLVRALARTRDTAVRLALGASRADLARGQIAESLLLSLAAGALGVLLTIGAIAALRRAAPPAIPRVTELSVDARVLCIALLLSLLTSVLCALAPLLLGWRGNLAATLRDGRASTGSRLARRTQGALTVLQFALALTLLAGAGLLVQSFRNVQGVDVGFTPQGILALRVAPPSPRYDSASAAAALYARLVNAARDIPGVESAAFVNHAPLGNGAVFTRVRIPGRAVDTTGAAGALYKTVSADYLRVTRIPLQRGRWFTESDMTPNATGVVVSATLAESLWPGTDPIGSTITVFKSSQARADFGAEVTATVIGVVGSVRHFGMESARAAEVYVPYTSEPWAHGALLVRTRGAPEGMVNALRPVVAGVDPDIPVAGSARGSGFQPLAWNIASLLETRRWLMSLLVVFAAGALALAALGIYGVTSYVVSQRTGEIGVRMALGATARDVAASVVGRGALLATLGVALGLAGAVASARLVRGLLFETTATDPIVLTGVSLLLAVVALAACWIPARRAARIDPATALRAE